MIALHRPTTVFLVPSQCFEGSMFRRFNTEGSIDTEGSMFQMPFGPTRLRSIDPDVLIIIIQ